MNKTAFVTGGSKVTGKGIALALGEAGYDVGISYVTSEAGAIDAVKQLEAMGVRAKAYQADGRDISRMREAVAQFAADFGRFDLLVNNAGITKFAPFCDVEEALFDAVVDLNLKGTYFTAQAAAKEMKAFGNGGTIINISSVHAKGTWPGDTIYATTKAAICRLTEAMALDLAPDRIRAVCLAPGYVASGWEKAPEVEERVREINGRIPAGRFVEPKELGGMCVFLASETASYINGTTLFAEGGALLPVITENNYL